MSSLSPPTQYATGLTTEQQNLLYVLGTNYWEGRPRSSKARTSATIHKIAPPIECPAWACILLPCIPYIFPSIHLFRQIEPTDAEVLVPRRRYQDKKMNIHHKSTETKHHEQLFEHHVPGQWISYDAVSLCVGDIVRVTEGDLLPADIIVLSFGMDLYPLPSNTDQPMKSKIENQGEDLIVDFGLVTGESRPRILHSSALIRQNDPINLSHDCQSSLEFYSSYFVNFYLFCGGRVLQGSCIGVVVAIGKDTILSKCIHEKIWPPRKAQPAISSFICNRFRRYQNVQGYDSNQANYSVENYILLNLQELFHNTNSAVTRVNQEKDNDVYDDPEEDATNKLYSKGIKKTNTLEMV